MVKIIKHCEWCGEPVTKAYYSLCVSIENIFFGNYECVKKIESEEKRIILKDGSELRFDFQADPSHYVTMHKACEQLLCSEKCEDEFVAKYGKTPLWTREFEFIHAAVRFTENNLFRPATLDKKIAQVSNNKCEVCGCSYPAFGRVIKENMFLERRENSILEDQTWQNLIPKSEEWITVTSYQEGRRGKGHWFSYRAKQDRKELVLKKRDLCSYDCMYQLAKNNHSFILTDSVLEKDRSGIITEDTLQINKELGNPVPCRPSFIGYS